MSDVVLPFYLVCDQSFTMLDQLDDLYEGLRELLYAITTDPVALGRTRLGIHGFSASAAELLPLTRLDVDVRCGRLRPGSAACFGSAFRLLRSTIERDVRMLRADWRQVSRPAVFFLAGGRPTDPLQWPPAHAWLIDASWRHRPEIVAFGIGDVDAATLAGISTRTAFLSDPATAPGAAVWGFTRALTRSILVSGAAAAEHGHSSVLDVPAQVAGFIAVGDFEVHDQLAT